jgi:diguanylate cyclase (GGDEF)-like protein/PAS domain S-box-containing protein
MDERNGTTDSQLAAANACEHAGKAASCTPAPPGLLDHAINLSADAVFLVDAQLRMHYVNDAACRLLGHPREALLRMTLLDTGADCTPDAFADWKRKLQEGFAGFITSWQRHSSGRRFPVEISASTVEHAGARLGVCIVRDVSERRRIEQRLREREAQFRKLSENSPDAIVRYDRDFRRLYVNPKYAAVTGVAAEAILGKTPAEQWLIPTMPAHAFERLLRQVLDSGDAANIELDWTRPDGERVCFALTAVPEHDAEEGVTSVLSISRDITALKLAQEALYRREQEFRTLVENSPDTIARYDRDCRRTYANPKLLHDMGGDVSRILGSTPSQFPGGASALLYESTLREVMATGQPRNFELRWKRESTEFCSHIRMAPEFSPVGEVVHVLAVGRDITEIDRYRRDIHHQAFYDSLTGLPNRALLFESISRLSREHADRGHPGFALMLLDIDNFKEINDALGHGAGDHVLQETGRRMLSCVPQAVTVARLGGDEFSVLLPDAGDDAMLATTAGDILKALAAPLMVEGHELFVSGSIGIARYPRDTADIEALYKFADSAMYLAKRMGRNNAQFYVRELTTRSVSRMELEVALRKALRSGELTLHYQPQIDLATRRLTGAEALLRWYRPGHDVVPPGEFIPVAEAAGLITEIGEWVLRTACQTVAGWNRAWPHNIRIAVNLSTRQFASAGLVDTVQAILQETGCRAEWLELEITESLLLEDNSLVGSMLSALRDLGLSISIDDFGTGYSALSYLHRFPVRQIKIDRSFISDMLEQRDKRELVKAMLSIGAALELETVAEGVETSAQAASLAEHGCKLAQGYFFGKPMTQADFESLLGSGAGASQDVLLTL